MLEPLNGLSDMAWSIPLKLNGKNVNANGPLAIMTVYPSPHLMVNHTKRVRNRAPASIFPWKEVTATHDDNPTETFGALTMNAIIILTNLLLRHHPEDGIIPQTLMM